MKYYDTPIIWSQGDWDDSGYRDVAKPYETNPDPLVVANSRLACYRVYNLGDSPRICSCYGSGGMDQSAAILLREPVVRSLERANVILKEYRLKTLILDGFRSVQTQAKLWVHTLTRMAGPNPADLSIKGLLTFGQRADEIGSYASVVEDDNYLKLFTQLIQNQNVWFSVVEYAQEKFQTGRPAEDWLKLYITFKANLGKYPYISLDAAGHTSHGNGGTEDSLLINISEGDVACLGAPYDYPNAPSKIDFFEGPDNFEEWRRYQKEEAEMSLYLAQCGITNSATRDDFNRVRDLRRVFYWTMEEVGVGRYGAEYWHRTHGNSLGGNQAKEFPGAGNSCHAIVKNIRDTAGKHVAVWGNEAAHRMADAILKTSF